MLLTPVALLLHLTAALPADPGLLFRAAFDGTAAAEDAAGSVAPTVDGTPTYAPGRFGQALVAGAEVPLLHYPTAGHLIPRAGTVSLWIQPQNWSADDPNFHSFFECGTGQDPVGWLILYKYYQSGWLLFRYADEHQQVGMATATPPLKPGEWHHLAATWDPHGILVYVDGNLAATAPSVVTPDRLAGDFRVGDSGWHVPHAGARTLIDELRVYGHALSAAEIRRLAWQTTLGVQRDPVGDAWRAVLTLPDPGAAATAKLSVAPAGGGDAVVTAEAPLQNGVLRATLDVGKLPPGDYLVRAAAMDAGGQVVATAEVAQRRLAQERVELANGHLRLTFDGGSGAILGIASPELGLTARATAAATPPFTLEIVSFADHARFYRPTDVAERPAGDAALRSIAVTRAGTVQRLTAEYHFDPEIAVTLTAELPDDSAVATLRLRVRNVRPVWPSDAVRLPRITFPQLNGLRLGAAAEDDRLASGWIHGELRPDPAANLGKERLLQYPGSACVPWQDLSDAQGGLALLPLSDGTCQLDVLSGAADGLLKLANRWYTVMEPGDEWLSPAVELAAHPGGWHWAADRYRAWALRATPPRKPPAWLKDCDGWLGMGGPNYKFRDFPKMLDAAHYYGFSYLQLWAQMILGGAYYCYFYPNPDLGTVAELKEGIRKLHAGGGHVGFYSNVICFDASVDNNAQLREVIAKYKLKDMPPLPRFYDEAANAVFVGPGGRYGKAGAAQHSMYGYLDGYWAMDPCSPWWQGYLADWIKRWHNDYGADVWYLDSFPVHGYGLEDASYALHLPHPKSLGAGQIGLLKRIRQSFDGPMLYEGVACAAFMPYTNWCLGTEFSFGSSVWSRPEIFAYSFGDVYPVFSGSCNVWTGIGRIYPDLTQPRHEDAMDYVFLLGERFDTLGLYPLKRDDPFGEHVRRLVALRRKVRDVVYAGRLRDTLGLAGMPERVEARWFAGKGAAVVTIWDRREERTPWKLAVDIASPGWPEWGLAAQLLQLDGSAKYVLMEKEGERFSLPIEMTGEVAALRVEAHHEGRRNR